MLNDDPLSAWLMFDDARGAEAPRPKARIAIDKALDALDQLLADPPAKAKAKSAKASDGKKRDFDRLLGGNGFSTDRLVRLAPSQRARAEALYTRLWHATGKGKTHIEEALLSLLGYTGDPASIPFFRDTLALSRNGDKFTAARHRLALAGMAHAAILHKDAAALEALQAAAQSDRADVRAEAILVLGRTIVDDGGPLDLASAQVILRAAESDPEFEPRFLARGYLMAAGVELQPPDPDALIAIEARLGEASRTIEVRATDNLEELAGAILDAFRWDHDHLWSFYMNGRIDDPRFELSPFDSGDEYGDMAGFGLHLAPRDDEDEEEQDDLDDEDIDGDDLDEAEQLDDKSGAAASGENGHSDGEEDEEDDEEIGEDEDVEDILLGHLGLTPGHRFLFLYDFGDNHRFDLRVVATDGRARPDVRYPNVAEKHGRAPSQYRS